MLDFSSLVDSYVCARGRQFYAVAIRTRGPHKTHLQQMDKRLCLFVTLLSIFVVGIVKIFGVLHQGIQTIMGPISFLVGSTVEVR